MKSLLNDNVAIVASRVFASRMANMMPLRRNGKVDKKYLAPCIKDCFEMAEAFIEAWEKRCAEEKVRPS